MGRREELAYRFDVTGNSLNRTKPERGVCPILTSLFLPRPVLLPPKRHDTNLCTCDRT